MQSRLTACRGVMCFPHIQGLGFRVHGAQGAVVRSLQPGACDCPCAEAWHVAPQCSQPPRRPLCRGGSSWKAVCVDSVASGMVSGKQVSRFGWVTSVRWSVMLATAGHGFCLGTAATVTSGDGDVAEVTVWRRPVCPCGAGVPSGGSSAVSASVGGVGFQVLSHSL